MNYSLVELPIQSAFNLFVKIFKLALGLGAFFCISFLDSALAEDGAATSRCSVTLRFIKGSGSDSSLKGVAPSVGNYLKDIKGQLQPIPYRSFKVLGDDRKNALVGEKADFIVSDAADEKHRLSVIPVEIKGGKVSLAVDWASPSNESLLSTNVTVDNGKDVVVGTDTRPGVSTIISIGVNCL